MSRNPPMVAERIGHFRPAIAIENVGRFLERGSSSRQRFLIDSICISHLEVELGMLRNSPFGCIREPQDGISDLKDRVYNPAIGQCMPAGLRGFEGSFQESDELSGAPDGEVRSDRVIALWNRARGHDALLYPGF